MEYVLVKRFVNIIEKKERYFDYNELFTTIILFHFRMWHLMWENLMQLVGNPNNKRWKMT